MNDLIKCINLSRERFFNLASYAKNIKDKKLRLEFLVNYFLNDIDPKIAMQIDETTCFYPFKYDYSFIYLPGQGRIQEQRNCGKNIYSISLSESITDSSMSQFDDAGTKISPLEFATMFALKMGTCKMLANEFQRLMFYSFVDNIQDYNLANRFDMTNLCRIINKKALCYDHFEGKLEDTLKSVKIDEIRQMNHFFNVVFIDGKIYKIDLAGALTMKDYALDHSLKNADLSSFICEIKNLKELNKPTFFENITKIMD